jgi:peptide/nickel transport system permease protein
MLAYALRRIGLAFAIILCAVALLFCLVYLVPGDPTAVALGPLATPEIKAEFRAHMGLDQPIAIQFLRFLGAVASGDLGRDVFSNRSVSRIIGDALPHTAALTAMGIGWAILIGIPLGCWSAMHRDSWFDRATGALAVAAIAVPSFVVALYGLLLFAVELNWLPAIGVGEAGHPLDQLVHLALPSFAIGLGWVGYLARLVRASLLEVLGENHIRTARAFGLSERRIVFRYALRLAVLPTIALLGVGIGHLLSGAVFAEIVFARPGIGKLVFDAAITRNFPVVNGTVLVTTALFALCTLAADLLAAWLDPRVRASL